MSELVVFIVGAVLFAITVYGTVVAGGIALSRRQLADDPQLAENVDGEELVKRVPFKVKY